MPASPAWLAARSPDGERFDAKTRYLGMRGGDHPVHGEGAYLLSLYGDVGTTVDLAIQLQLPEDRRAYHRIASTKQHPVNMGDT